MPRPDIHHASAPGCSSDRIVAVADIGNTTTQPLTSLLMIDNPDRKTGQPFTLATGLPIPTDHPAIPAIAGNLILLASRMRSEGIEAGRRAALKHVRQALGIE
jgi:hypothetical protein